MRSPVPDPQALLALALDLAPVFRQRLVDLAPVRGQCLLDAGQFGPELIRVNLDIRLACDAAGQGAGLEPGQALAERSRAMRTTELDDLVVEH